MSNIAVSYNDLLAMIGQLYVENAVLRSQLAQAHKLLEAVKKEAETTTDTTGPATSSEEAKEGTEPKG